MRTSKLILTIGTALAFVAPTAVYAQAAPAGGSPGAGDDTAAIIVTARRVEERLQDVPISITVFNQQQLSNKNIKDATDLATYTPSLSANNNFGQENTTFAIRGFVQDVGTAPSVGSYFADVVVPRGGASGLPIGDTINAGQLFDLQNAQVLKGPQGTLFGRNTTGGAVLLVPQKPTDKLEGYVEGGYGNYNQRRIQAVINVPLSDTFRVRLGVDRQLQDGYLKNISGIGPKDFNNLDYTAVRLSIDADLTPDLENYIVASYYHSKNNGAADKITAADPNEGFGFLAAPQIAAQNAHGFYSVENGVADAGLTTTQWQVINNTTWKATDNITIKNIVSYAELKQSGVNPIFAFNAQTPGPGGVIYNSDFQESAAPAGGDIAHEGTFTEEFRVAGNTSDSRLTYQTGAYFESVRPLSAVGSQSAGFASCTDRAAFQCSDALGGLFGIPLGNINYDVGKTAFRDIGLYAQGTYKLTDQLKATAGFRYTWDREEITDSDQIVYALAQPPGSGPIPTINPNTGLPNPYLGSCLNSNVGQIAPNCINNYATKSSAPTWHFDLDYTPNRDLLLYASYSRGYRAATISPNIPFGGTEGNLDTTLNYTKQEKVDTYEIGLKKSFTGAVRGTFNVSGFYNNFSNQQIQVGFLPTPAENGKVPETAAPLNAGKSKIYGLEVESSISPFQGFEVTLGYTYLRTRIDAVLPIPSNPDYITQNSFNVGDPETGSPRNKLVVGADYTLPTPSEWGKITIGGSVTYRSSELSNYIDRGNFGPINPVTGVLTPDQESAAIRAAGTLPALTLIGATVNWNSVGGKPFDLGFFVTNLTNKHYYNFAAGLGGESLGFEVQTVGAPRMFGGTLKVHF